MHSIYRTALILTFALGVFACSNQTSEPVAPAPAGSFAKVDARLLSANNTFGLTLFRTMYHADADANVFMSPLSVSLALGMTMNGAKGETRSDMAQTLGLQGLSEDEINKSYRLILDLLPTLDPGVDIAAANSIWSRFGFPVRPEFLAMNRDYFDATAQELDFADPGAADVINGWVFDNTKGRIENIVPNPIPSNVVMYLINTVYFKAPWSVTFDEELTKPLPFVALDGGQTTVPTMHRRDSIPYYAQSGFAAADLRYGNGAYAMTVILPEAPGRAALDKVIDGLNTQVWQAMMNGFHEEKVTLSMPKFTVKYELTLNNVLKEMGMGIAFEPDRADLSGISAEGGLFISEVKHKSFVEVTEQGTEAAAATSVEIGRTSVDPDLYALTLNRPFLYVVRERETGTILFMGVYQQPE